MAKRISETGSSVIVYDDSKLSHISPAVFTAEHWGSAAQANTQDGGRGSVLYVNHQDVDWVIRHYYRGGLIGKLLTDQYWWTGQHGTRSFREWQLLTDMQAVHLPAPVPVAALYQRRGFWYTGDLITENLGKVESFASVLETADQSAWEAVGACIASFHRQGFCHADLNASNIQLDASGAVYVLDWDRGHRLPRGAFQAGSSQPGGWQQGNLNRLQRSLNKESQRRQLVYDPSNWQALLQAYAA